MYAPEIEIRASTSADAVGRCSPSVDRPLGKGFEAYSGYARTSALLYASNCHQCSSGDAPSVDFPLSTRPVG